MSRSALEKQMLKQMQQVQQTQQMHQMQQQQQRAANAAVAAAQVAYAYAGYGLPGTAMAAMMSAPAAVIDPSVGYAYPAPAQNTEALDGEPKSNILPMHGNSATYNINNLLYNNIMENPYFHALYQLRTYHEVIDEIRRSVRHVEPWETGTSRYPSSAFCLLVKFMLMKLTVNQMNGLLSLDDSPLVRALGFLYLRYTCPPGDLWKWYEPFLEDPEEFQPGSDKGSTITMGQYCVKLLTDMQYFGTTLPRIPVPIERKFKVLLLLLEEKKRRREKNLEALESGRFCVGMKVRAIYGDADNEPAWYDAVVDSRDDEQPLKYWVTFPEYGNSEVVDLGDIELPPPAREGKVGKPGAQALQTADDRDRGSRSRSRDRDRGDRRSDSRDRSKRRDRHRGRSNSRDGRRERSESRDRGSSRRGQDTGTSSLLQKVMQSERDASAAVGRNYAQRPASYKGSLSMKLDRYTARRPSEERDQRSSRRSRSRSPGNHRSAAPPASSSRSTESSAEQQQRLKLLKERYGDASASAHRSGQDD